MRSESSWRSRAVALLRHAAGAAGLGLAWIVLSGSPAAALGEITDIASGATSSAVSTVTGTAATPVQVLPGGEETVGAATETLGEATSTTTSGLATVVEAAPAALEPVLPEPLVPVLEETTGGTSGLVQDLGGAAGGVLELADDVVADPLQVIPLPVPVLPAVPEVVPVPALPAADAAAPAPVLAGEPALTAATAPVQPVWEPTILARLAASGLALAPEVRAAAPVLGVLIGGPDPWSLDLSFYAMPASPGAVGSGGVSGGSLLALAGGAFLLALLWRAGPRLFPAAPDLPGSPAFDPGSTPD